ncbi:hypothetical protein R1sor_008166 [Riccia sorocarpa]|uniref:MLO-like protein n=1 Tax=Riccia sorocarpa TaxID=122646 RepID=A0ABD3HSJ9_9MARC
MAGGGGGANLENTPTYAVAIALSFFIGISLFIERIIHRLKKYLKRPDVDQKPLKRVLDKLTDELMLLGFISLLLTVLEDPLTKICVTHHFANSMLPCKAEKSAGDAPDTAHRRLLASLVDHSFDSRRTLVEGASDYCERKGKAPFVSLGGLHQLHIFIFVLGVTHVTYSLVSVLVGFVRVYSWKDWEPESAKKRGAQTVTPEDSTPEPELIKKLSCKSELEQRIKEKFDRTGHVFSFLDKHIRRYKNPVTLWTICFFRQFLALVRKDEYLLFRVAFTSTFRLEEDFHYWDYLKKAMELDFKIVIGISWWLWAFVILFLLLNVVGWYTYFWASFIPTILVLIIGTKQQHVISVIALKAKEYIYAKQDLEKQVGATTTDTGAKATKKQVEMTTKAFGAKDSKKQVVEAPKDLGEALRTSAADKLFWFNDPKLRLKIIHFVIFQNSFELAIIFWILVTFGWNSCILGHHTLVIIRIVVGAATIFLSSYSIIPIYALVTQMDSNMRMEAAFGKTVTRALELRVGQARARLQAKQERDAIASAGDEPSVEPEDEEDVLAEQFQKIYGKERGLQRLNASRIQPNRRSWSSENYTNSAATTSQDRASESRVEIHDFQNLPEHKL